MEKKNILKFLSILFSVLGLFLIVFADSIWSELWILSAILYIPVFLGLFVVFLVSIVKYFQENKTWDNIFPGLIVFCFVIMIIFIPIGRIKRELQFKLYKPKMSEVVDKICAGEIPLNNVTKSNQISLPDEYSHLTIGYDNQIDVEIIDNDTIVLFYTFRGTPDGAGGFLFKPESLDIEDLDGKVYFNLYTSKDLGDNWFYVFFD
jgi:hypothetical protein